MGLGNLEAGYSVTQLVRLIGKWFQGTDLPSGTFASFNPATTHTVAYSPATSPLDGAGTSLVDGVNQGKAGGCWLLAALAELAALGRRLPAAL